jgi:predicted dehydrogenase
MDIGCYCLSLARYIFAAEPKKVLGIMQYDPAFQTDSLTSGILDFGTGTATFTCSTQLNPCQRVNILGTEGRIEIEIPFNAPPNSPCRIWHQQGGRIKEIIFPVCNQYTLQADAFSLAIINDTEAPLPLEDAVNNMRVLEKIMRSARSGLWV